MAVEGPILFDEAGRCIAAPVGELVGRSRQDVEAIVAVAARLGASDTRGKSHRTEPSGFAEQKATPHESERGNEISSDTRSKNGKLLSSSAVCRRLRLGKAKLVSAVRAGALQPDWCSDSGLVLWLPSRLREIAEALNAKIKF